VSARKSIRVTPQQALPLMVGIYLDSTAHGIAPTQRTLLAVVQAFGVEALLTDAWSAEAHKELGEFFTALSAPDVDLKRDGEDVIVELEAEQIIQAGAYAHGLIIHCGVDTSWLSQLPYRILTDEEFIAAGLNLNPDIAVERLRDAIIEDRQARRMAYN